MSKVILLALLTFLPANALAQQDEKKKEPKHDHETYLKTGVLHWEGTLESLSYNLNGMSVDLETYFNSTHAQLSGWSVGYRKDGLRYADSGYLLNFRVFRTFDLKVLDIKTGGGLEWGIPAFILDRSEFKEIRGEIRYRHIYPVRNSNVPYLGTTTDGIFYPFTDVSLSKRKWIFLIEGGVRANLIKYGFDNYTVRNDVIIHNLREKRMWVLTPFASVGIKLIK